MLDLMNRYICHVDVGGQGIKGRVLDGACNAMGAARPEARLTREARLPTKAGPRKNAQGPSRVSPEPADANYLYIALIAPQLRSSSCTALLEPTS